MRQPRRCRKVLTNLTHTVLAEGVSLITTPAADGVEVLDVERVPYRKALELAMSGAIMQAAHVASLILGLRAAGKIELRACFRLALNSPTSARGREETFGVSGGVSLHGGKAGVGEQPPLDCLAACLINGFLRPYVVGRALVSVRVG
jgi:hypothetical protein